MRDDAVSGSRAHGTHTQCTLQSSCGEGLTFSHAREELLWRYCYQLWGPGHSPSEVMHPSEKQHLLPLSLTYEVFKTHSLTPSWCCSGSLCCKYLWTFCVAKHRFPREKYACDNFLSILLPLWLSKPALSLFSVTCFLKRRLVGTAQVFHTNSWSRSCQFSIPSLLNVWCICSTHFSSLCFYQSLHKTCVTCPSSCSIRDIHKNQVQP